MVNDGQCKALEHLVLKFLILDLLYACYANGKTERETNKQELDP